MSNTASNQFQEFETTFFQKVETQQKSLQNGQKHKIPR